MLLGPRVQRLQEALVGQVRSASSTSHGGSLRVSGAGVRDESRKMRIEVIAAALSELLQQIAGPV